ncbi:hypothetical protein C8Q76DRAFT_802826 [Earliella scabrosa]|nr:hypothetical protein C8Q76DRAFT_802826 [Earliella scabrosa]
MSHSRNYVDCAMQHPASMAAQIRNGTRDGLAQWSRWVRRDVELGDVQDTVSAIMYSVRTRRGYLVRLPVGADDEERESARWPEDINLRHWFPFGTQFHRICTVPGSAFRLANDYTIVTSNVPEACPRNLALRVLWGLDVRGNVLILRHATRGAMRVTSVHSAERRFIDLLVSRFLRDTGHEESEAEDSDSA